MSDHDHHAHLRRMAIEVSNEDEDALMWALAEIERLRALLRSCAEALNSKEMEAVWSYLYAHGYKYTGPTVNMIAIHEALGAKSVE